MIRDVNINFVTLLALIVTLTVHQARCDVQLSFIEDPTCVYLCEKIPAPLNTDGITIKSCCERGCRFFNLIDLRYGLEQINLNNSQAACESSCSEAYSVAQEREACILGCEFMVGRRMTDLLIYGPYGRMLSMATYLEEGNTESTFLLMSPINADVPESDILADPGLRKELFPGWWDSNGFKLPQTHIRTVPIDSMTSEYGIPSDYVSDVEQSSSETNSDWLGCASRHTGIPQWLLALTILGVALSALWIYLESNEPKEPPPVGLLKEYLEEDDLPTNVIVYLPDEAPLYKEPPPTYNSAENLTEEEEESE